MNLPEPAPPNPLSSDKIITEDDTVNVHSAPSKVEGSYLYGTQPLDVNLRPYYQLDTVVHITNDKIYQQYVITPLQSNIPKQIQSKLQKSTMPRDINHYNVKSAKYTSSSKEISFSQLIYDSKYSSRNERLHFRDTNPFIIPPNESGHVINVDTDRGSITSGGRSFRRISDSTAKSILSKGNVNPQIAGY